MRFAQAVRLVRRFGEAPKRMTPLPSCLLSAGMTGRAI
jgi:hypothetical protein